MSEEKDQNLEIAEKLENEASKLRVKRADISSTFAEQGMEIYANHLAADILEKLAKQLKREDEEKESPTYE